MTTPRANELGGIVFPQPNFGDHARPDCRGNLSARCACADPRSAIRTRRRCGRKRWCLRFITLAGFPSQAGQHRDHWNNVWLDQDSIWVDSVGSRRSFDLQSNRVDPWSAALISRGTHGASPCVPYDRPGSTSEEWLIRSKLPRMTGSTR